jgi:hypothetical protein
MDPTTTGAIIKLIVDSLGSVAELLKKNTNQRQKSQLEAFEKTLQLSKDRLETMSKECIGFQQKVEELTKERDDLLEIVAYHNVTDEYDLQEGLLYRKDGGAGPYCPVDRYQMTRQVHQGSSIVWKCPKCALEAQTVDPSYFKALEEMRFVKRPGGGYQF